MSAAIKTPMLQPLARKILSVLKDGMLHTYGELKSMLWDELGCRATVAEHVKRIRKSLPRGQAIVCVQRGHHRGYMLVRLVGEALRLALTDE